MDVIQYFAAVPPRRRTMSLISSWVKGSLRGTFHVMLHGVIGSPAWLSPSRKASLGVVGSLFQCLANQEGWQGYLDKRVQPASEAFAR
jgi:hypothetical protein